MSEKKNRVGRRKFVEQISKAALATSAFSARMAAAGEKAKSAAGDVSVTANEHAKTMPQAVLGRTGLRLSKISLGTNPPTSRPVLAYCVQQGVSYIDSAAGYAGGNAERILGELFEELGLDRRKFCLTTKSYDRTPEQWATSVAGSCERLRTDYVELFFIHDLGRFRDRPSDQDPTWIHNPDVVRAAKLLKKSGRIRFFGFSVHRRRPEYTYALIREAAKSEVVDVVMLQYNFRDENNESLREAIATARKARIGIIAVKPQGGNRPVPDHLQSYMSGGFNRWQAAIRWLAHDPLVDVVCSNMRNVAQAKENIAAIKAPRLKAEGLGQLRTYALATSSSYCHACERCLEVCPQQLDIPTILRATMYHENYDSPELARETYAAIPPHERADHCLGDGACERTCPNGLAVRRHLEHAAALFGARS